MAEDLASEAEATDIYNFSNQPEEKLEISEYTSRFGSLSPRAKELYLEHNLKARQGVGEWVIEKEDGGYKLLPIENNPMGASEIQLNGDGTKILKYQSPGQGFRDLAEGPAILVMRELQKEEGRDPDLFPHVYQFGIEKFGKRFVKLENVPGDRIFQDKYRNRNKDLRRPTHRDLLKLLVVVSESFPALEKHGFFLRSDFKPEDVFITPDGNVRIIDFDITRMIPQDTTERFYSTLARRYLVASGVANDVSHAAEMIEDYTIVNKLMTQIPNTKERLAHAEFLRYLAGYSEQKPTHQSVSESVECISRVLEGKTNVEPGDNVPENLVKILSLPQVD